MNIWCTCSIHRKSHRSKHLHKHIWDSYRDSRIQSTQNKSPLSMHCWKVCVQECMKEQQQYNNAVLWACVKVFLYWSVFTYGMQAAHDTCTQLKWIMDKLTTCHGYVYVNWSSHKTLTNQTTVPIYVICFNKSGKYLNSEHWTHHRSMMDNRLVLWNQRSIMKF